MGTLRVGFVSLSVEAKVVVRTNAHPSSAIRIAGASASATLTFPEPRSSMVSHQTAAHPGTVAALMFKNGISEPLMPSSRHFSRVRAAGARPDPFKALTSPVLAS